ncbi:MAG: DUF2339 domain-containing protein [Alphaproteobacteria bacterium]|nr:DUF2339 domain-containing protein [Alphaproteobacteria bacterium]
MDLLVVIFSVLGLAYLVMPVYTFMLGLRLRRLERQVAALAARPVSTPAAPAAEAAAGPMADAPAEPETEAAAEAVGEAPTEPAAAATPPSGMPPRSRRDLEGTLARHLFVWIGGGALALAGLFLVRYSIEEGLLGPAARVGLGLVLALALLAGAEWTRRRGLRWSPAPGRDYVPQALAAGGIFTAYAAVYSAYALYDLIGPPVAFLGLAVVSALAFAAALLFGPFVALLGIVGGYLTPALVSTQEGNALALFSYLLLLSAGALWTVRASAAWWLGWAALAGACAWPLLWFAFSYNPKGALEVSLYLPALLGLFGHVRWRPRPEDRPDTPFRPWRLSPPDRMTIAAGLAILLLAGLGTSWNDFATPSIAGLLLVALLAVFLARREPELDLLVFASLAVVLASFYVWKQMELLPFGQTPPDSLASPIEPGPRERADDLRFLLSAGLLALFSGAGGFAVLWGARRPPVWAFLAAAGTLGPLQLAFHSLAWLANALVWSLAALALSALLAGAAQRIAAYRQMPGGSAALAIFWLGSFYALGLVALFVLGFEAWRVALAMLLPAIAWLGQRIELPALRRVAAGLALALIGWLALIDPLAPGGLPLLGYAGYQYALPALCFYAAARLLERQGRDGASDFIGIGAWLHVGLFLSLKIRDLVGGTAGDYLSGSFNLLEASLHTMVWLGLAFALYATRTPEDRLARWSVRCLVAIASFSIFFVHLLSDLPLFSDEAVGEWPLVNTLSLAYLVPGLLLGLLARAAAARGARRLPVAGFVAMLALTLLYVSLEVRRAFHGTYLDAGKTGLAEIYAYSLAWGLFAAAILALGILRREKPLRLAGLGLVALVVCKVFLYDLSELEGLWRAASFLGLGLGLVAVGLVYRRLDRRDPPSAGP